MAKLHDEQRDPEHAELVADILKNRDKVVALVYRSDAERRIETETRRNGGEYVYVIAHVYEKGYPPRRLIIEASPKLSDFGAVAQRLEIYQKGFYQQSRPTGQMDKDPSKQVRPDILDKHSQKVIVTLVEDPDFPVRKSAKEMRIVLIVQNEATGLFRLSKDAT